MEIYDEKQFRSNETTTGGTIKICFVQIPNSKLAEVIEEYQRFMVKLLGIFYDVSSLEKEINPAHAGVPETTAPQQPPQVVKKTKKSRQKEKDELKKEITDIKNVLSKTPPATPGTEKTGDSPDQTDQIIVIRDQTTPPPEERKEVEGETKVCEECKEEKPLDEFYKYHPKKPESTGRHPICKSCHNKKSKLAKAEREKEAGSISEKTKYCKTCKQEKPIIEFAILKSSKERRDICKLCNSTIHKKNSEQNRLNAAKKVIDGRSNIIRKKEEPTESPTPKPPEKPEETQSPPPRPHRLPIPFKPDFLIAASSSSGKKEGSPPPLLSKSPLPPEDGIKKDSTVRQISGKQPFFKKGTVKRINELNGYLLIDFGNGIDWFKRTDCELCPSPDIKQPEPQKTEGTDPKN